jgi:uncharacterized protein (DUF1501 family)
MNTNRREFLLAGLGAGATLPIAPRWLQAVGPTAAPRIMVVVEIQGGWDYFNQIVPVNEPVYYTARPTTGIGIADTPQTVLPISAAVPQKWAAFMQAFKDLYDRGDLAVINNVGYPNPDLSHFESFKKIHAANPMATAISEGWLARWINVAYNGGFSIPALDIEQRTNEVFTGSRVPVLADLASFGHQFDTTSWEDNVLQAWTLKQNALELRPLTRPTVRYLAKATADAITESALLRGGVGGYTPRVTYPAGQLANDLKTAALYITANLQTQCYYVSTTGFDLHSSLGGATGQFADRMRIVTQTVKAFLDDMRAWNRQQDVVVMVLSEFGRRFGMNGSMGTDHGHGMVWYLAGDPVVGGFYGTYPNLQQATQPYYNWYPPYSAATSVDFRSVYATVLERWYGVSSQTVLNGAFPILPIL